MGSSSSIGHRRGTVITLFLSGLCCSSRRPCRFTGEKQMSSVDGDYYSVFCFSSCIFFFCLPMLECIFLKCIIVTHPLVFIKLYHFFLPRLSVFLYKGTDSSFLSAFIDVVSSMILCGMTVAAAMMITLGFNIWCQNITRRFKSCDAAAGPAIDKADGINTFGFYMQLGTAQVIFRNLNEIF